MTQKIDTMSHNDPEKHAMSHNDPEKHTMSHNDPEILWKFLLESTQPSIYVICGLPIQPIETKEYYATTEITRYFWGL